MKILHINKESFRSIKNYDDTFFLGKWCTPSDDKKKYNFIDHPLSDHKKREFHYNFIENEIESLSDLIINKLNSFHKVNFTKKNWNTILGHYLLTFSHIVYIKWLLIQNSIDLTINKIVVPDIKKPNFFVPKNLTFYKQLIQDENFYSYLTILIIKKTDNDFLLEKYIPSTPTTKTVDKKSKFNFLNNFNGSQIFFYKTSISKFDELFVKIKPKFYIKHCLFRDIETKDNINLKIRSSLKLNNFKGFRKILYELIWDFLPINYLEDFNSFRKKLYTQTKHFNPRAIVTSMAGSMEDDLLSFFLAIKGKNAPKVISLQHGGLYGTAKYNSVEKHEIKISDFFLSWGWNSNENVVPSFLHKHLRKKINHYNGGKYLVFINYSCPKHDYRISPSLMSTDMDKYIDSQSSFFKNIRSEIKEKVKVRLYVDDFNWGTKKKLDRQLDSFNYSSKSYDQDLKRAKIIVPTYNSTTILESLALNIPTVALFDPLAEKYNENSLQYFRKLFDVKIIHYDYKSAANFINSIWNDVDSWWNSKNVKRAKSLFVKKFANLDKNSSIKFKNQIIELLK